MNSLSIFSTFLLLFFAVSSSAAESETGHGKKKSGVDSIKRSPSCPQALFDQIFLRDKGWTLFDFSNASLACKNHQSDRSVVPSKSLERVMSEQSLLATHADPEFLNRCLDSVQPPPSIRQRNAAIGEYVYLSTRTSVAFRSNLESAASIGRLLGDGPIPANSFDQAELSSLPNARQWVFEARRSPECFKADPQGMGSMIDESVDAMTTLVALEKAQSSNRQEIERRDGEGGSQKSWVVIDAEREKQLQASIDFLKNLYPWTATAGFSALKATWSDASLPQLRTQVRVALGDHLRALRANLLKRNGEILKAQACLHSQDSACFKEHQKLYEALPQVNFDQMGIDKARGLPLSKEHSAMKDEFGIAQCRLGVRGQNDVVNATAAELGVNVALTVATAGVSAVAAQSAKGLIQVGAQGLHVAAQATKGAQIARGVNVATNLYWLGKGAQEAYEKCADKAFKGDAPEKPGSGTEGSWKDFKCRSASSLATARYERDWKSCALSVALGATNALPFVPSWLFRSQRSHWSPEDLVVKESQAIKRSADELIPEFQNQNGFTSDAYNFANIHRGNAEVLAAVKKREAVAREASQAIMAKIKSGEADLDMLTNSMKTVMEAQYYREMREALERSGSALAGLAKHETPLAKLPADIAHLYTKGLGKMDDVERLRLISWVHHLSPDERSEAIVAIARADLLRHGGLGRDHSARVAAEVLEKVDESVEIASGKAFFNLSEAEINSKVLKIAEPMLKAGVSEAVAKKIAQDLVESTFSSRSFGRAK